MPEVKESSLKTFLQCMHPHLLGEPPFDFNISGLRTKKRSSKDGALSLVRPRQLNYPGGVLLSNHAWMTSSALILFPIARFTRGSHLSHPSFRPLPISVTSHDSVTSTILSSRAPFSSQIRVYCRSTRELFGGIEANQPSLPPYSGVRVVVCDPRVFL
ncbi:unnamed protein product [Discosporangium mesarthrocarpum]